MNFWIIDHEYHSRSVLCATCFIYEVSRGQSWDGDSQTLAEYDRSFVERVAPRQRVRLISRIISPRIRYHDYIFFSIRPIEQREGVSATFVARFVSARAQAGERSLDVPTGCPGGANRGDDGREAETSRWSREAESRVRSVERDPNETCDDPWPAISPRVVATVVLRPMAVVMPLRDDHVRPRRRAATGDTPGPVAITVITCHSVTSSRPPCPWPTAVAARQLTRSPGMSRSTGRVLTPLPFAPLFPLPVAFPRRVSVLRPFVLRHCSRVSVSY